MSLDGIEAEVVIARLAARGIAVSGLSSVLLQKSHGLLKDGPGQGSRLAKAVGLDTLGHRRGLEKSLSGVVNLDRRARLAELWLDARSYAHACLLCPTI